MVLKIISLLVFLVLFISNLNSQDLQINEVVTKNYNSLISSDGEHYDWIEIYNNSNDTIQLYNYYLTDEKSNLQKWNFPSEKFEPHSFLIVFASKKNVISNNEIHCNFSLSREGEKIYLSKGNTIIDKLKIPEISANLSFGRISENNTETSVLDVASPNFSNSTSNHLKFSHKSGFYDDVFDLKIESLKTNHKIYYTLNGDIPDQNSMVFSHKLNIYDRSRLPNGISNIRTSPEIKIYHHNWQRPKLLINKITSLKFVSYYNNQKTSVVYTRNYLINQPKSLLGTICLTVDSNAFFNEKMGIYVPGDLYNSDYPNFTGNYTQNNKFLANVVLFNSKQKLELNQDCDIRLKGKTSRVSAQKSLKIYARKEYGNKYFNAPIIKNDYKEYKKVIIRNTQGSSLVNLILDDFCNLLVEDLNIDHSKTQFYRMYLNGEYWGIHSVRNELSAGFLSKKYNLEKEDINIIDINYSPVKGNDSSFLKMIDFISENDLIIQDNYNYVESIIDIESYIDYQIAQMFLNNSDWVGNNLKIWRSNSIDSKWRYIFYDLDGTFVSPDMNMFEYCTATDSKEWRNAPKYTFLLRNLLKNEQFKNQFILRYSILLETIFSFENTILSFNKTIEKINPEINENYNRWQYSSKHDKWIIDLEDRVVSFLKNRPCIVKYQLNDFFNLENERINCSKEFIKNIDFKIFPNPNNGDFKIRILTKNTSTKIIYSMYNSLGKMVKEDFVNLSSDNTFFVESSDLPNGVYIINIKAINKFYGIEKMIINK